jgi:hypothetical protein
VQRSSRPRFSFLHFTLFALLVPARLLAISEEEFFQASMIDDRVQGQITASGVRYERDNLVITHPYLPLGPRIQVTNLDNEQSVVAEVIDRPRPVFHSIGLSAAVAQQLGVPPLTTVQVSITAQFDPLLAQTPPSAEKVIPVAYRPSSSLRPVASQQVEAPSAFTFRLQFGFFAEPANATLMQHSLNGLGIPAVVATAPSGKHFRVLSLSTYESSAQALSVADLMMQRGLIREAIAVR